VAERSGKQRFLLWKQGADLPDDEFAANRRDVVAGNDALMLKAVGASDRNLTRQPAHAAGDRCHRDGGELGNGRLPSDEDGGAKVV
jgi:hypothetical protein